MPAAFPANSDDHHGRAPRRASSRTRPRHRRRTPSASRHRHRRWPHPQPASYSLHHTRRLSLHGSLAALAPWPPRRPPLASLPTPRPHRLSSLAQNSGVVGSTFPSNNSRAASVLRVSPSHETIPHAKNHKILSSRDFYVVRDVRFRANSSLRLRKTTRPRHLQTIHRNPVR